MAAIPKLSPEQWGDARKRWEADPRKGFPWLIDELSLPVSAEAVRLRSKSEGWEKSSSKASANQPAAKKAKPATKLAAESNLGESKSKLVDSESEKNAVGRPTLYRDEYAEQVYKLCLLGMTDEELAESFGVDERTINSWKLKYPKFRQSLISGKDIADADVAEGLYKRAVGYSHPDVHVSNFQGAITITELTKHYPPDTGAAKLWLINRQPKKWKDKVEIKEEINLNIFPAPEVLKEIFDASLRRSTEKAEILAGRRELLGIVVDMGDDNDN